MSGHLLTEEGIVPADVLARVQLLRDELELVRFEMGEPKDSRPQIAVAGASPREVIFQSFTLLRKANQLHFELTGELGLEPDIALPPDIQPYHVWRVVDAAYERVLVVKRRLGITQTVEEKLPDHSTTPTAVFRAIVQANRQFDAVIKRQLSTLDVYQQVRLATRYAARLLQQFPEVSLIPAPPAFERGKRPVDVYNLLLQCYQQFQVIAEHSGIETLKLEVPSAEAARESSAEIAPTDVYNIALLLLSELSYLHAQLPDAEPPQPTYDPNFKVPAQVYQQAEILLRQLLELEKQVEANPKWLAN
ncbi:MAG: hypothetical protein ACE5IP_05640 [Terriglobia bacterium]